MVPFQGPTNSSLFHRWHMMPCLGSIYCNFLLWEVILGYLVIIWSWLIVYFLCCLKFRMNSETISDSRSRKLQSGVGGTISSVRELTPSHQPSRFARCRQDIFSHASTTICCLLLLCYSWFLISLLLTSLSSYSETVLWFIMNSVTDFFYCNCPISVLRQ